MARLEVKPDLVFLNPSPKMSWLCEKDFETDMWVFLFREKSVEVLKN